MSQYDGLLEDINTQFDWLVQTGDKTVVPLIKKDLAILKQQLDGQETLGVNPNVTLDQLAAIEAQAKPDRLAAARAAKAQKAQERADLLAQNTELDTREVSLEDGPISG